MLIMASVFEMIDPVVSIGCSTVCTVCALPRRCTTIYDASSLRKSLESDHGDLITLLNVFDNWVKVRDV